MGKNNKNANWISANVFKIYEDALCSERSIQSHKRARALISTDIKLYKNDKNKNKISTITKP